MKLCSFKQHVIKT